jgi:DnaJ-class molecular chaperone
MTDRICSECDGLGEIEVEYMVGGYTPDRYLEIRMRLIECPTCNGWGESVEQIVKEISDA